MGVDETTASGISTPVPSAKATISIVSMVTAFLSSHLGKYLLIGGTASAIDVGVFIGLYEIMGVSALVSHSVSIPLSALFSFTCNAYLNFKATDNLWLRLVSFSVVVAVGYLLGAAVIWVSTDFLTLGGTVGKLISLPLVFLLQYFLNATISFRKS